MALSRLALELGRLSILAKPAGGFAGFVRADVVSFHGDADSAGNVAGHYDAPVCRFGRFCENVGMTVSTAFVMFDRTALRERRIPLGIRDFSESASPSSPRSTADWPGYRLGRDFRKHERLRTDRPQPFVEPHLCVRYLRPAAAERKTRKPYKHQEAARRFRDGSVPSGRHSVSCREFPCRRLRCFLDIERELRISRFSSHLGLDIGDEDLAVGDDRDIGDQVVAAGPHERVATRRGDDAV